LNNSLVVIGTTGSGYRNASIHGNRRSFSLVEKWMKEGKLSNVAPGEPAVNEPDLKRFLHRGAA
jgi:hypothetical protein